MDLDLIVEWGEGGNQICCRDTSGAPSPLDRYQAAAWFEEGKPPAKRPFMVGKCPDDMPHQRHVECAGSEIGVAASPVLKRTGRFRGSALS